MTEERELLPAQRLLTVPFAFQSATAGTALDRPALEVLLAGATVQGTFAVAQNAVVLGSAVVHGSVIAPSARIGNGTIFIGPAFTGGAENTILFNPQGFLKTAGGDLIMDAETGRVLISTGPGRLGVGTEAPLAKLHVAGPAGEAGNVLVVSTGSGNPLARVTGTGEIHAAKFVGDGSGLTGISGGGGGGGGGRQLAEVHPDNPGFRLDRWGEGCLLRKRSWAELRGGQPGRSIVVLGGQ